MKLLHTISSIDISGGGPSKSISDLCSQLVKKNIEVNILTNVSDNPYLIESPNTNLQLNFVKSESYKFALNRILQNEKFDLLHGHGIWQMPVHYMSQIARRKNIPYIVSPRGMLEPWALNANKWKKKLALWLYQYKDLEKANCIHATAQMEADNIRKLGFSNPIAIIPNGIDVSEFPLIAEKQIKEKYTLLFLSRIHIKKGIELLVEAWSKIDKNLRHNWEIIIVGNGEADYIKSLQNLINIKELDSEIKIVGPQFGSEKIKMYHEADLFVLPTYSENFGIVVAEALACGVPVITTKGTPWSDISTNKAGWWIDIGVEPLVLALQEAITLCVEVRHQMGINGRKLIIEKYSIETVSNNMVQLYEWVINNVKRPEFVYL